MRRHGLDELIATPFAQASGMRRNLLRFAPETAAAVVWLNLPVAWLLLQWSSPQPLAAAAAWCILLGGLVLVTVPAALAAQSFAAERDRDTLDALLLTRVNRRKLVWGRYWGIALPWLRFVLWTLPLWILWIESVPPPNHWHWGCWSEISNQQICAFGSRPLVGAFCLIYGDDMHGNLGDPVLALGLRFLFDSLDLLLATAVGMYLSVRLTSSTAATASALIAALAVGSAFGAADWECLKDQSIPCIGFAWLLLKVAEILLTVSLVRMAAGRFDRCVHTGTSA